MPAAGTGGQAVMKLPETFSLFCIVTTWQIPLGNATRLARPLLSDN